MELKFFRKVERETINMPCVPRGVPRPTVRWQKDGVDFEPTKRGTNRVCTGNGVREYVGNGVRVYIGNRERLFIRSRARVCTRGKDRVCTSTGNRSRILCIHCNLRSGVVSAHVFPCVPTQTPISRSLCTLIYPGFEISQFFVHLILRIIKINSQEVSPTAVLSCRDPIRERILGTN